MIGTNAFSSFSVSDIEAAKAFYTDVLGVEAREEYGGLSLHPAGTNVMVYPKGAEHQPATFTVLNFQVDDIDAAVDQLTAKGVIFEQYNNEYIKTDAKGIARTDGKGPNMAWFKDPSGNIMACMQVPAQA
jgi:catechol 2,3-dioxygenase-like lactoylglutathione lyase family enzyme